jgi:hypothetical protein
LYQRDHNMPVSDKHPEYLKVMPRYSVIRDIVNNSASQHIRNPDMYDLYSIRNVQYKQDAVLTNFTNLTREGLTGLVFRKKLRLAMPPELSYLEEDFTGTGINIYQFSQHTVSETIQLGRYGFLVDYYTDGGKAYVKPYCAESIINWKAARINGVVQLTLVVLQETVPADEGDLFCQDTVVQYRVLRLDENNKYIQEIYNADEEYESSIEITNYNGSFFNYIPFVFVGSANNDWDVDQQPLYDLAVLNLAHYRNSADEEESIFLNGQPYLVIDPGTVSEEEFRAANPQGIRYGSRTALVIGNGGHTTLMQANPNQMVSTAMDKKLEQAAKIGARLITPPAGRETAEAARIRYGAQHSALYTLTSNIEWAVIECIETVCEFMGLSDAGIEYILNKDFYDETADANVLAQQIMLMDKGVISSQEIREYEERANLILDADDKVNADLNNPDFPEEKVNE